jgi:hypothetical protein
MSKRTSSKRDQITNKPSNQGRPGVRPCLYGGCRAPLSASALAGVVGYTKSTNPKGRAVDSSIRPSKARHSRKLPAMHGGLNIRRPNLSHVISTPCKGV